MSTTTTKRVRNIRTYITRDGGGERKAGLNRGQTGIHHWHGTYMRDRGRGEIRNLSLWQLPTSVGVSNWQHRVQGSNAAFNPRLGPG
jgi:hypothetical protein